MLDIYLQEHTLYPVYVYIYIIVYIYIVVWGTVLVAHNLKHSALKRCTNIYCVIDFAAKPPADLAHNFPCYHRVARTSSPSSLSYYSAWPAFWSAYLPNAFAVCVCV